MTDVETAGSNAKTDVLLGIAATILKIDEQGWLAPDTTLHFCVEPFTDTNLQLEAPAFDDIDPNDPSRGAVSEHETLHEIFKIVRKGIKASGCNRAIVVAHNTNFDHSLMIAVTKRAPLECNPFHPFATFGAVALVGLALGQAILSEVCQIVDMNFNSIQAYSTLYDTKHTAVLFCEIVNRWKRLGGWPLSTAEEA